MMRRLPMQPLSVGPAFGRLLAHTDEIPRSSKCRLLRVDRKWLNDATGEQAFETVPRQAVVADIWAQGGAIWRQQLPKSFLIRRRRSSGFRPPTARLTHWTTLRAKKARSSSSSATIVPMLKR